MLPIEVVQLMNMLTDTLLSGASPPPTFGLYAFRAISGSLLSNLHKTALYWCDRLHPPRRRSPFWFESSR